MKKEENHSAYHQSNSSEIFEELEIKISILKEKIVKSNSEPKPQLEAEVEEFMLNNWQTIVCYANQLISLGQLEKGKDILKPLLKIEKVNITEICEFLSLEKKRSCWDVITEILLEESESWNKIKNTLHEDYPNINLNEYLILILMPNNVGDSHGYLCLLEALSKKHSSKIILFINKVGAASALYDLYKGNHIFQCYKVDMKSWFYDWRKNLFYQPLKPGFPATLNNLKFDIPGKTLPREPHKKTNYFDAYKPNIGLPVNTKLSSPIFQKEWEDKARLRFTEMGFKDNKTVLISPLANNFNTRFGVNKTFTDFWEEVCHWLLNNDFSVVINGKNHRALIKSKHNALEIPLQEVIPFANYCGFFIGIRSGLCQLLCFSSCQKKIIYPVGSRSGGEKRRNLDLTELGCEEYIVDPDDYAIAEIMENWVNIAR